MKIASIFYLLLPVFVGQRFNVQTEGQDAELSRKTSQVSYKAYCVANGVEGK